MIFFYLEIKSTNVIYRRDIGFQKNAKLEETILAQPFYTIRKLSWNHSVISDRQKAELLLLGKPFVTDVGMYSSRMSIGVRSWSFPPWPPSNSMHASLMKAGIGEEA